MMGEPFKQKLRSLGILDPNGPKILDLSNQKISETEMQVLEEALKKNDFVETLILSNNPKIPMKLIHELVRKNSHILTLDLSLIFHFGLHFCQKED